MGGEEGFAIGGSRGEHSLERREEGEGRENSWVGCSGWREEREGEEKELDELRAEPRMTLPSTDLPIFLPLESQAILRGTRVNCSHNFRLRSTSSFRGKSRSPKSVLVELNLDVESRATSVLPQK